MDRRRAAGALLALAACVAYSAAAPTASNQTSLDLYEGAEEGCYYNFQHYGEGDRIMTNEPCLNCTCHNRMLMCYLRVCPFTKPIGQDCTVEKRADQCCPIVTCPDVPVDLLTSTSTSSPMEYGATGLGKLDMYGCSINGRYFSEGSKVPSTPNKPCEHCYCIRNMTTCVMQECTLHVDGCTPIYHKDVCCPVRYSCDHPEDEIPLLDDMTTTVRPTQGFLLTTTTLSPVTQMTQDCVHEDKIFPDGALIKTEKACEHCYCMKGDIVCVVQECGTPMENEGKNCTSLAPREGQCCPDTYICEGDDLATGITEIPTHVPTEAIREDLTALPPKIVGDEGSGYTVEPEESYTGMPLVDSAIEGSGEEDLDKSLSSSATPPLIDESFETSKDTFEQSPNTVKPQTYDITTEPDNGYNTISSEYLGEKVTGDSILKPTVSSEGSKVTEPTTISVGKPAYIEESVTNISDLTTEKSFRKDDQGEVTKESFTQKELDGLATVAADEINVIESTTGYENIASSEINESKFSSTLTPTHILHEEETTEPREPSTESKEKPVKEPATLNEIGTTVAIPESYENTESSGIDKEESSTTVYPGRIPGEGDCLYNGVTYKNESDVPSFNKCDLSCKCVSSIVKCDPITCSPAPEFMDNCQAVYDTPESCCPTYICQSKETIPPQSHSQMSGTDSPLTKPLDECSGSDCLLTKDKVQHEVSDTPKTTLHCDGEENCIKTNIPEVVPCEGESCTKVKTDCHSAECGTSELSQKPEDKIEEQCLEESCRRKETGISESKPSTECTNSECLQEIPVIPTVTPDISTMNPLLTESATELSSDEYSTEGDIGHKILDSSIKEKEPSTEHVTIKPHQITEAYDFVQTTPEHISLETTELGPKERPLISHPTKVSTADQSFITSETPEIITVKTSSEAENYLILSETTPSDGLVSYVTETSETVKLNEPVTETDSFVTIKPDIQKPDLAEKEKEHIKDTDSFVTESESYTVSISGQDYSTESPLSYVTQLDHTELPQEQPKVVPEEYVTKSSVDEEPEIFTNKPEYQTDLSLGSKTPEISTEVPKSIVTSEENKDLTTKAPEETTNRVDHISTKEKEELQTEVPESSTLVQQQSETTKDLDETVTQLPEITATHRLLTEVPESLEHGEEENEIPTKITDHKVTTESYKTPLSESEIKRTTESVQKHTEVITEYPTTAAEKELEKEYFTELSDTVTTTAKPLISENEVYTESPEIMRPVEIGTQPEKIYTVTKPPHYKEEENEIPTELPEHKITAEDQSLQTITLESINEDREEKTELPETMTTHVLEHLPKIEQHEQLPESPVHSEGEYSTEILERTTYEPLSQETVEYELPKHQPEEYETQTKIPQFSVTESQKDLLLPEMPTESPEILITQIPEIIKHKEQEVYEISTEEQSLPPETSHTVLPEIMGTIDTLATIEPTISELYVTSKLNEEPVSNIYEPSTSSLQPESDITTPETDTTSLEMLQSESDHTRPHASPEASTERPDYSHKTTVVEIESHSPVTGNQETISENQETRFDTTETLTSHGTHTTELPALDVTRHVETGTEKLEELGPETVTTEVKEPEHVTENVEILQTEIPSVFTSTDNTIVGQEVTEKEIQTEHSTPLESEIPEPLDKEPLEVVTEHKELTGLPEIFTVVTEPLPTKIIEIEKNNELENLPTESQQIITSIPEETSETYHKDLTIEEKHLITTENPWFVESDHTKQFETDTELSITNDIITKLPETSTKELEPSRKSEHYPSSSVTETLLELTKGTVSEIQVPEIQMSTTSTTEPSSLGDTESFMATESEGLEVPAVTTINYEEKTVTVTYNSVTKPNQLMEEDVSETHAPNYVPHEHVTQIQETTSKIKDLSVESHTELPMSLVTELGGEISSKPSEIAETLPPEIVLSTMTPELSKIELEKTEPSTEIPRTEDELSTKSSEVSYTASPELKLETENDDKGLESVTTLPHMFSTQDQETDTILPEIQEPLTEQHPSSTQSSIHYDTVPGQLTDTDTIGAIAAKGTSTEIPEHHTDITEYLIDIQTESVPEEATAKKPEKEFITEPHEKVQPEITEITPSTSEAGIKYTEQPIYESHEEVTEEKIPDVVSQEKVPTEKVKYIDTTPYSVELEEHPHGDTEPEKPTFSTVQENEDAIEDKNKLFTTEKALESELHDAATTEFAEIIAQTTPHATLIQEVIPALHEKPEPHEKSTSAIPETEKVIENITPATSDLLEGHTTLSSAFEMVETEKSIPNTESTVDAEKGIIKITEQPIVSTTVEPSIPEEELILVTQQPVHKIDGEKPTQSPIETYTNPENEITEDKSTETPEQKNGEKPEVESTEKPELSATPEEKPSKTPDEYLTEIPQEKPYEIAGEKLSEIPEEKPTESYEEKHTEIPEEHPTEASVDKISDIPESNEILEEKPSEIPEMKPSEIPEENLNQIPEEKPTTITEENISATPVVTVPTVSSEEKLVKIPEERPTVTSEENLSEIPEEKPTVTSEEKLIGMPEEKPTESAEAKPSDISEEKTTPIPEDKLTEIPEVKPTQISEEKPSEIHEVKPTEMSDEKRDEITTTIPEQKLGETPEEKPTEISEVKPSEMPGENLTEISKVKPSESPQEKPVEIPEERPSEIPKEKPSEMPVETLQEKPDEIPQEKPSDIPEEKPSEVSEQKPSETPDEEVGTGSYGQEPDYVEEDQAFGPGTCRYGGKVYVSAQQIPRDDPCDFCFCFRSDIICLQQSCPPPIHGCHEEPIQGFCCPRYECPVSMATTLNVTTTTTTTTTTLPPHFPTHAYKGAAQRKGCLIKGHTYKVGEVVRASSGPCLHCTCGGDGQMKCDPKACTPEPMLRQMIAAAVSSKRRR